MPSKTPKQHRAMAAAAFGHSTLGIPKKVGKDFVAADKGKPVARAPRPPIEPDADDAPLPGRPGIMSGRRKTSDFDADDAAFATQVPPTNRLAPTAKNFLKRPKKKIGDALGQAAAAPFPPKRRR